MGELKQRQRDWALVLPSLVVGNIAERLTVPDFVRFAAVCKPWSSVLRKQKHFLPRVQQFPWLMVPTEDTGIDTVTRTFISLPDGRSYKITSPELLGKHIISSDNGWLVLCDNQYELSLLQPITGVCLPLPSILTIPNFEAIGDSSTGTIVMLNFHPLGRPYRLDDDQFLFIQKVLLSCSPDCVVVVLYSRVQIAFASPGDSMWTIIKAPRPNHGRGDILFVDSNSVVGLTGNRDVQIFDFSTTKPQPTLLVNNMDDSFFYEHTYIAICDGDMFAVHRERELVPDPRRNETEEIFLTVDVLVYKLVWNDVGGGCWVETKDLKGHAFFIGYNSCICLAAKDVAGVKENCIYFTDDYGEFVASEEGKHAARDVVVFNLEKGSHEFGYPPDAYLTYPPAIWFIPSLH